MSWPYIRVGCTLGTARCAATKGGARDGFLRHRDVSCTSRRDARCRVRGGGAGGHDMSWPYVRVGCILGTARCGATKGGARDGFLRRPTCLAPAVGTQHVASVVPGPGSVCNHNVQRPVLRFGISPQLRSQFGFGCCVSVNQTHFARRNRNVAHKGYQPGLIGVGGIASQ